MFLRIVAVVVQTIFFILVFASGSFLPGIFPNTIPMWRFIVSATHYFVMDGLVFAFIIFLLVLGLEAATKRFRSSALLTTISFVLAVLLAIAMRLPFMDRTTV